MSSAELLISFSDEDASVQNRIATIDLTGKALQVSPHLAVPDIDDLAVNPITNDVYIFGENDSPPRRSVITYFFGSPTITPVGNLVRNVMDFNTTFSPNGNELFTVSEDNALDQIVGDSYITIGSFDTSVPVFGIAFVVPEPSALVLLGIGAFSLLGYGWRRR